MSSPSSSSKHGAEHHAPAKEVKKAVAEVAQSPAPVSKAKDLASSAASSAKATIDSVSSSPSSAISAAKEKASAAVSAVENKAEEVKEAVVGHKETDPAKRDPAQTVKEPAGEGSISQKQEGLSNTDTKNVVFNTPRGDAIKMKSEGAHESAKLKGTVDVNR